MKYVKETARGCSKHSPMESSPDLFPETTGLDKTVTANLYTEIISPSCFSYSAFFQSNGDGKDLELLAGYQAAGVYVSLKPMGSLGRDLDLFGRQKVSRESKWNMNLILLAGIHQPCSVAAPVLYNPISSSVAICLSVAPLQFVFSLGDRCLSSSFIM